MHLITDIHNQHQELDATFWLVISEPAGSSVEGLNALLFPFVKSGLSYLTDL